MVLFYSKKVLSDLILSKTVWQCFLLTVSLTESCEVQNNFSVLTAEENDVTRYFLFHLSV